MKKLLQAEEAIQFTLALVMIYFLPVHQPWWIWLLLFFAPDVSMVGYAINARVGGILYNLFHHKAISGGVLMAGIVTGNTALQATGLLLWGHAAFDRMLGYGLKHLDSFAHTHLGIIGKTTRK